MRKQTKLKAFVLSVMMLAGMLLPVSAFAQSDGFFRDIGDYSNRSTGTGAYIGAYFFNNQQFGSDSNGGYNFNNQTFGQDPVPLGSGMLVLTVIGAGYIAVRRSLLTNKKSRKMKKLSTLIITIALVLGLTQCKKNVETITTPTGSVGEPVYISFNVGSGDKHIVYPGTGAVVYTEGDKLYVGNNGKYIGTLEYHNGTFGGTIYGPSTNDYLHVYFVGGLTPSATPSAGSTTSFTVNISNQISQLPVLSYGHSTQKYTDGTATYGCTLLNQCGLVKFVPSQATFNAITVSGMKTTATIDFATPGITPTDATGAVTLYSVSGSEKWAILLPQDVVTNATAIAPDFVNTASFIVPTITSNCYLSGGIAMNLAAVPEGAIQGLFSVSNSKKVFFSQGNLQYQASTNTWRFAENQYDVIGTNNTNLSTTYSGWIDLFGWGTSGYEHGATYYQPWSNGTSDGYYNPYNSITTNLFDGNGKADWGYNAISNGGNAENSGWRTLTKSEWDYVFNTRSTPSGVRFAKAFVTAANSYTYYGVILLPDDWSTNTYSLNDINNGEVTFSTNTLSYSQWSILNQDGAVFLPCAGYRNVSTFYNYDRGIYWAATYYNNEDNELANCVYFHPNGVSTKATYNRHYGCSVRLVRDIQ